MHDTIIEAIQQRRYLEINYPPGWRVVEPHSYGVNASAKSALRAYQTSGASNSETTEGWRLFLLEKILGLRFCGEHYFLYARDGYERGDPALSGGIIAEI